MKQEQLPKTSKVHNTETYDNFFFFPMYICNEQLTKATNLSILPGRDYTLASLTFVQLVTG